MQIEKSNGVYFLQNRYQQAAFVLNVIALDLLPIAYCRMFCDSVSADQLPCLHSMWRFGRLAGKRSVRHSTKTDTF